MRRAVPWTFLICSVAFLLKNLFGTATPLSLAGFLISVALWYVLTWRRARSLDAVAPRKPFNRQPE